MGTALLAARRQKDSDDHVHNLFLFMNGFIVINSFKVVLVLSVLTEKSSSALAIIQLLKDSTLIYQSLITVSSQTFQIDKFTYTFRVSRYYKCHYVGK